MYFISSLFLLLLLSSSLLYGQTYTLQVLGAIPGDYGCTVSAVNNLGHVVGTCGQQPYLWTPETGITALPLYPGAVNHAAHALNDSDVIVGVATIPLNGSWVARAIRWQDGAVEALPGLTPTGPSVAGAINNRGWITGWATGPQNGTEPFFYSDSSGIVSLASSTWGVGGYGHDINVHGQIAGYRNVRAFRWDPPNSFQDLGVPAGWGFSYLNSINSEGLMVGAVVTPNGNATSFARYLPGTGWHVIPGGRQHNSLAAVNDAGVAVGNGQDPGPTRAYRWSEEHGLQLLDSLIENPGPWRMLGAHDLNNLGQIAGSAHNVENGDIRPVLLTPVDGPGSPAPVTNLTVVSSDGQMRLTWSSSSGAALYRVHGSTVADFHPSPDNVLAAVADTTVLLPSSDSRCFYCIIAVNTSP